MKTVLGGFLFVFGIFTFQTSAQQRSIPAENQKVAYDAGGLPRCVSETKNWRNGIIFMWSETDQYVRAVKAVPLENLRVILNMGADVHCGNWDDLTDKAKLRYVSDDWNLKPGQDNAYGFEFDEMLQKGLAQAQEGLKVYVEDKDVDTYVKRNRLSSFSYELNQKLSRRYGLAFASAVYAKIRNSDPANSQFIAAVNTQLEQIDEGQLKSLPLAGIKVAVSHGFLEPKGNGGVDHLVSDLQMMGASVYDFSVHTTYPTRSNAKQVADEIMEQVKQGEPIILIGASKGATEALGALAELKRSGRWEKVKHLIPVVLLLSPNIGGSFFVDWAMQFPQRLLLDKELKQAAIDAGEPLEHLDQAFEDQSTESMQKFIAESARYLPQEPFYLEVSGVTKDPFKPTWVAGTASKFENEMRQRVLESSLFPLHFANDTLIEYPHTELKAGWVQRQAKLSADASHSLLAGEFEGLKLSDPLSRQKFALSVMLTLNSDRKFLPALDR